MKKFNQKGFSVVEVLIVILVLGLLAGLGWYIKDKHADKKTTSPTNTATPATTPQAAKDPYEGWKTYTDDPNGISFKYPADWKAETGGYGESKKLVPYKLSSPDNKEEPAVIGDTTVVTGSRIEVVFTAQDGKTLQQIFNASYESGFVSDKKEDRKINDQPAFEYEYGYEKQTSRQIRFNEGTAYHVHGLLFAQDISKTSRDYPTYIKILESVSVK